MIEFDGTPLVTPAAAAAGANLLAVVLVWRSGRRFSRHPAVSVSVLAAAAAIALLALSTTCRLARRRSATMRRPRRP